MSEHLESLVNVRKIEEIKSKEEANRYLELGWKLLKIAEEREKDEGGYYNVVIYCVGWYSSEEPKYLKKQKIDLDERKPYLKTKRRGFIRKLTKILIFVLVWIISVYLVFTYFCPQQHSPNRPTDVSSIIRRILQQPPPKIIEKPITIIEQSPEHIVK